MTEDTTTTQTVGQEVVYGDDSRLDYYESSDEALQRLTRESIAAMVSADAIVYQGDGTVLMRSNTLGQSRGLCDDEAFYDHPTAASCSGTLIDDDLILTAGHCVQSGCSSNRWVFNYYYETEGNLAQRLEEDVYECDEVVALSVPGRQGGADYGIVRLDRPVTNNHVPAAFSLEQWPVADGDSLHMIGFGSGIPAKLDSGGVVLGENRGADQNDFRGSVDAFGGNSGSGVFDADLNVVGILVAGEQDYEYSSGCARVALLPESGGGMGGEQITYAILAVADLCSDGYPSERLCGIESECGDGICSLGEDFQTCPADCEENGGGGETNPDGWVCDPNFFDAGDGCDCTCGTYDPDCDDPNQRLFNCRGGQFCNDAGVCEDERAGEPEPEPEPGSVPSEWDCDDAFYGAGDGCDCDCGAFDLDCDDPDQQIFNCGPGEFCDDRGMCFDPQDPTTPVDPIDPTPVDSIEPGTAEGDFFGDIIELGDGSGDGCASAAGRVNPFGFGLFALGLIGIRRRR
ncbi:MAG: V8-like Glu-specific endopeptidase [Bradymonadia bacterium]|jgi:V8-like Glu-specific endopeptidase